MKSKELREKDIKELKIIASDLRMSIGSDRMEISMNKSSKTHSINKSKRDLARVLTVIKEKELSE
ncbi:MAG: 50S ribosomal protein L29 [Candidatus Moranbacteria bacterium]|nr:50S ribosomal protein L29 [Candidatus Moranbacteria bacterium]